MRRENGISEMNWILNGELSSCGEEGVRCCKIQTAYHSRERINRVKPQDIYCIPGWLRTVIGFQCKQTDTQPHTNTQKNRREKEKVFVDIETTARFMWLTTIGMHFIFKFINNKIIIINWFFEMAFLHPRSMLECQRFLIIINNNKTGKQIRKWIVWMGHCFEFYIEWSLSSFSAQLNPSRGEHKLIAI